jgi:hypothetical protein
VQSVPAPHLVERRRWAATLVGLLAAGAIVVAAVMAWPAGEPSSPAASPALPVLVGGKPLQQARCAQWNAASTSERQAVVAELARVAGGPSTSGGSGATLSSSAASDLFTRTCSAPFAQGFLLYELYNRRAAFGGPGG